MIGSLRGVILDKGVNSIILDVNGVGYDVQVATHFLDKLEIEQSAFIFVYTDVRENAISLFGFQSKQDREVFLLLKKVKGIGSKTSQLIVAELGSENVLRAIGNNDIKQLTKVSGVGSKTASRILVELGEGVRDLIKSNIGIDQLSGKNIVKGQDYAEYSYSGQVNYSLSNRPTQEEDAILALQKLGFNNDRAEMAVNNAIKSEYILNLKTKDAGEILKEALKYI